MAKTIYTLVKDAPAGLASANQMVATLETLIRELHAFSVEAYGCGAEHLIELYQHFAKWAEYGTGVDDQVTG